MILVDDIYWVRDVVLGCVNWRRLGRERARHLGEQLRLGIGNRGPPPAERVEALDAPLGLLR
jgi:hypothetical protein